MNCGLSAKKSALLTNHFALNSFTAAIQKLIGCNSADSMSKIPWSCFVTSSETNVQISAWESPLLTYMQIYSYMGCSKSVIFAGSKQTLMLLASRRLLTLLVIWPLKLSIIITQQTSWYPLKHLSGTRCMYGTISASIYCNIVSSVGQCFGDE